MHSYQHNIKTFNNATRHLTRVERSLYRDLIELYYDTEQPLDAVDFDRLARRVLAVTVEEKSALKYVLDEFFILTGEVYTHEYCDHVIESFNKLTTAKALAGKASAKARKEKAEARKRARKNGAEQNSNENERVLNECSTVVPNQKPETTNNKPNNNTGDKLPKTYKDLDYSSWPSLPDQKILSDWMDVRRHKKARNTQTAIDGIGRELVKAVALGYTVDQCITEAVVRSWMGFKAEWMKNSGLSPAQSAPRQYSCQSDRPLEA